MFFPRSFAIGTKAKSYSTISWDNQHFDQELEPLDEAYAAECSPDDVWSAKRYKCLPLVDRAHAPGPLITAVRGKGLVVAAGHVSVSPSVMPAFQLTLP